MVRDGEVLRAAIPRQGMAGKVEYHVELAKSGQTVEVPPHEAAVARFKGDVPNTILILHVFAIVIGLPVFHRRGLRGPDQRPVPETLSRITFGFLVVGGLILGPIVQKYAFDAFWTGWPLGEDLDRQQAGRRRPAVADRGDPDAARPGPDNPGRQVVGRAGHAGDLRDLLDPAQHPWFDFGLRDRGAHPGFGWGAGQNAWLISP